MLTEKRFEIILESLNKEGAVKVQTLTEILGVSESTVRRDLSVLDKRGFLKKVHGGAASVQRSYSAEERDLKQACQINDKMERRIGAFAADLVGKGDFVFIDADIITISLIEALKEPDAVYVTNGLEHAERLLEKGYTVYLIGGRLSIKAEAVIGEEAMTSLEKYHFTLGFFGSQGVHPEAGLTLSDIHEAAIKQKAVECCRTAYVLADESKFNRIRPVRFGELSQVSIITDRLKDKTYHQYTKILEVDTKDPQENL